MKRLFLRLVGVLVVFAMAAAGGFAWWAHQPLGLTTSPIEVVIKPNSGVLSVGRQIQRGGVGMDPRLFQILVRITGHGPDLKAGGYQ
ncbi:MAG TPA: aminodeoxychorismate lyase, partial [Cupriavidus sp.]|nr:aminodeoxychorismate lyase [Cupriavidus sp.]